jgi:hypothetical protein
MMVVEVEVAAGDEAIEGVAEAEVEVIVEVDSKIKWS